MPPTAPERFFEALAVEVPQAIDDLRREVLPAYLSLCLSTDSLKCTSWRSFVRAGKANQAALRSVKRLLISWAARNRLRTCRPWIFQTAIDVLLHWAAAETEPEVLAGFPWTPVRATYLFASEVGRYAARRKGADEQAELTLSLPIPLGRESQPDYHGRCRRLLLPLLEMACESLWFKYHYAGSGQRVEEQTIPEHLEHYRALVRYLCYRETLDDVAYNMAIARSAAHRWLRSAAKALGVQLRPAHRPRKKRPHK